jgi:hypothetical protein
MMKMTKTNGSARKIIRCVLSVVVDISSVESICEPTYRTIRVISTVPVALSVRSGMNRNAASPPEPQATGSAVPGGLRSGQMSSRRSSWSM